MPAAVAGTEAVGVTPAAAVEFALQAFFHDVGRAFGDDRAERVGDERANHVVIVFQAHLQVLKLCPGRGHEQGESL